MSTLDDILTVPQFSGNITKRVIIPGSKSITNRAILIAAIAEGTSTLKNVLHSDDTKYMIESWRKLGIKIEESGSDLIIQGCGGNISCPTEKLYIGNAGTAARFLTSVLCLGNGEFTLDGNERMRLRPIEQLTAALKNIGGDVTSINDDGCPPLKIIANGLEGGELSLKGNISSQYISSIMLSAPYAKKNVEIEIKGPLVSKTYVEMTRKNMSDFGVEIEWPASNKIIIPANQKYQPREYFIEPDASSASYFFAFAAITGSEITIPGFSKNSTQGDLGLIEIFEKMGCSLNWKNDEVSISGRATKSIDIDMNTMSDVAPTLAVVAMFTEGKTYIRNVGNMRIKECDRIDAVATELRKLGANVETWEDGLSVEGDPSLKSFHGAELDTYDDHRIAMCLSLAGIKIGNIKIKDPSCVSKTFPTYWDLFLPLLNT